MRLLAWDTSSKSGAIVALEWDERGKAGWDGVRLMGEWSLDVNSQHSERLLWGIHQVLESARWKMADIDVFAVGLGPGSFTGLRIGVTTARTLAHTLNKPLIGVSSLAALARPTALWLKATGHSKTVLVACTDACKGELFALWGAAGVVTDCVVLADGDAQGLWKCGVEEGVIAPAELMESVLKELEKSSPDAPDVPDVNDDEEEVRWAAVGEGARRYLEDWKTLPASRRLEIPAPFPDQVQGRYLGMLAWEACQSGLARDGLLVHPRYVRASDAELKLRAGLLPKVAIQDPT